ncbi:reverse transcriptase domain-containing protein [Tanacetum coccineum]
MMSPVYPSPLLASGCGIIPHATWPTQWPSLADVADDMAATSAMRWQVYEVRGSLYEPMIGVEAMIGWQRLSTSTRSSSTDLFLSSSDPESVIRNRRRNLGEPSLLLDFEEINMSNNLNINHGPPPVAPIDGVGDAIVVPPVLASQFELKIGLLNLVTAISFHSFENDDPHSHIRRTSRNKPQVSSASGSSSQNDVITALTKQVEALSKHTFAMHKLIHSIQESCETCGGPHHYSECQAAGGFTQEDVHAATGNYNAGGQLAKALQQRPKGALPSNTIPNPREDVKVITTRSGITLAGPSVPPPPPLSFSKEVERDPEPTMDQVYISSSESTTRVPYPVVQPAPVSTPNEIPKRNPHQPPIPYPSSLVEALALMPKYAKMLKDLLTNKEKLLEMANALLNENCSVVLLKKLPEKLGDLGKFLIPCGFSKLEKCMALADLGANINLMPFSVWKKYTLPKLVPTRMTLELANRSVAYLASIVEDVFVQVGKFTFPANFIVVDYDVDPRVPLILGRPFLRMARALVVVHGEELILRVGDEKLTFKVDSTSKYSHSGNPTPSSNLVVASLSPSLTPFGDSDFLLEETDTLLSHFDHSLPYYEAFCFDIDHQEEKSSGSTTAQSHHSLPDYEAFCFNIYHHEEKSSGNTISHFDHSLLEHESFYFDISIYPPPIVERCNSHHEDFADELAYIISLPEYDHLYFDIVVDPGELTRLLKENISSRINEDKELKSKTSTKELTIHELNDLRLLLSNCDSIFSEEFSEIDSLVSFPSRNKDKSLDPGILIINGVHSKKSPILPLNDFYPILFVNDLYFLTDPSEIETLLSFPFGNEDKVFDLEIFIINGIHSFMRKFSRLPNDNFKIDKRDIFSEIYLKNKSLICFHPKDKEMRGELS